MPSLTWHIVKKDYRYLRPYLDIWWGILVCNAVVAAWGIHHILHESAEDLLKNNPEGIFTTLNWFCLALDVLMLGLVVDAILKNDSPIDEKAFWRTRPMGKGRMFRAKLISIGLFCFVVPGAIQAAGHLVFGFSPGESLRELEQFAVIQGCFVAVITCATMLFQRTIMGLLTFACIFIAVLAATAILPGEQPEVWLAVLAADLRNVWIFPGLLFVAILAVTAIVYTGHGRRTGFLVLVCSLLVNWFVSFNWIKHQGSILRATPTVLAQPETIKLSVAPSTYVDQPSYAYSYSWRLHGWITNPTLPELGDAGAQVQWTVAELNWPDGKTAELTYNPTLFWNYPVTLVNAPAAFAAAGYGRLIGSTAESWRNLPLGVASHDQIALLKKEPAKMKAQIHLQSGRLDQLADLPAVTGATWRSDMAAKHLVAVTVGSPDRLSLQFDEISPWHARWFETDAEIIGHNVLNSRIFLLYNPKTKECLEGAPFEANEDSDPIFTWRRASLTFSFAGETDATGQPIPNPNYQTPLDRLRWLHDARLVELQFTPTEYLDVLSTIEQFQLPADAKK